MFIPLSLAVSFSMIASYLLSSTFVPVASVWLLRRHASHVAAHDARPTLFDRLTAGYAWVLQYILRWRWALVAAYLGVSVVILAAVGSQVGTEIFPHVDTGQFQLRLKAATGTRIERTDEIAKKALEIISDTAGPKNVEATVGFIGTTTPNFAINSVYVWTSGPEEAVLRIALKPDSGVRLDELRPRLRKELPEKLTKWLNGRLKRDGLNDDEIASRVAGLRLSFEPADIVNEVMSFGSPTPVEVVVNGANLDDDRAYAAKVREEMLKIPALRDLQYGQAMDYPMVRVGLDRERLGQSGVTVQDVSRPLLEATSSSRVVIPNYWADLKNGLGYQVQVQVPPREMESSHALGMTPIKQGPDGSMLLLRDVANVQEGTMPGEYDRLNLRRLVSLTANIEGSDLGSVTAEVDQALRRAGDPPRGVRVEVRGQIAPMRQMFNGLGLGLCLAVVAIFLLLTAYFQSPKLALTATAAVPAVLAGVAVSLYVTHTTLNIQSFMGAIMAIGVAVANAILLVTFAERHRHENGADAVGAAVEGARHRLRPILMTSCAMLAGMVPMALALGEGGEQTAPLGRAVIGGLVAATLTTLLVLPAVFAAVQGRSRTASPSLDPSDPDSAHYHADALAVEHGGAAAGAHTQNITAIS